jgi:hypothetical protein
MRWPYKVASIWSGFRFVAMGTACVVSVQKMEEIIERLKDCESKAEELLILRRTVRVPESQGLLE